MVGARVVGDLVVGAPPGALGRVLANLVDNAVRETAAAGPGGRVVVSAARDGAHVELRVADRCGGIPADDVAAPLRDRLARAARLPDPRGRRGRASGLAVVAELVRAAGGRVAVDAVARRVRRSPCGCPPCRPAPRDGARRRPTR